MRLILIILLFSITSAEIYGQFRRFNQKEEEYVSESGDWNEGYFSTIEGRSRDSELQLDCLDPVIEWNSPIVRKVSKNRNYTLIVKARIDLTSRKNAFRIYVNGTKRFDVTSSNRKDWKVDGEEKSSLRFEHFGLDDNNDAWGYLTFSLPAGWVEKGQPVTFRIELDCSAETGWMIIYEDPRALESLQKKASVETWLEAKLTNEGKTQNLEIFAPPEYSGKMIEFIIGESIRGRKMSILREGRAYVSFTVKNSKSNTDGMSLEILSNGESLFVFPDIYKAKTVTTKKGDIQVEMEGSMYLGKTWTLKVRRLYSPD